MGEVDVGVDGEVYVGQYLFFGEYLFVFQVYCFCQMQLGFDVVCFVGGVVVVEDMLDLFVVDFVVGIVGQDCCVFQWDVDLVVEMVCYLVLDLFVIGMVFVYCDMEWMVDMVVVFFVVQCLFEFGVIYGGMVYVGFLQLDVYVILGYFDVIGIQFGVFG